MNGHMTQKCGKEKKNELNYCNIKILNAPIRVGLRHDLRIHISKTGNAFFGRTKTQRLGDQGLRETYVVICQWVPSKQEVALGSCGLRSHDVGVTTRKDKPVISFRKERSATRYVEYHTVRVSIYIKHLIIFAVQRKNVTKPIPTAVSYQSQRLFPGEGYSFLKTLMCVAR